ncbi:MAG: ribosome-associated translation inhibitor RaiA [Planctomycetaceae bacterium]|nr:ribosome-associated translation inhibitor RaiA [Planctomycetaceae bacterium]
MLIKITGKHVEITPAIRSRVEDKINKLPRYFDSLSEMQVVIETAGAQQSVELVANVERYSPLAAKEIGPDLYTCIDMAVHKMERQLNKLKEREREHKSTPTGEIIAPKEQAD